MTYTKDNHGSQENVSLRIENGSKNPDYLSEDATSTNAVIIAIFSLLKSGHLSLAVQ